MQILKEILHKNIFEILEKLVKNPRFYENIS